MKSLQYLRAVAAGEGLSLIILVAIAMPLKYLAGMPLAVTIVGSVHGLLFLLFLHALFMVVRQRRWRWTRTVAALAASIIPFGTLALDRVIRRELDNMATLDARPAIASR